MAPTPPGPDISDDRDWFADTTPVGMAEIQHLVGVTANATKAWQLRGQFDLEPPWPVNGRPAWPLCDMVAWLVPRIVARRGRYDPAVVDWALGLHVARYDELVP